MDCPRCHAPLAERRHEGVTIDACARCGGVWVDGGELRRLSGMPFAGSGRVQGSTIRCPRCDIPLELRAAWRRAPFEVDGCSQCGGVWLDGEELGALRSAARRTTGALASGADRWVDGLDGTERDRLAELVEEERSLEIEAMNVSLATWLVLFVTRVPLEVQNPLRARPWVTWSSMAALAALFAASLWAGVDRAIEALGLVPADLLAGRRPWCLLTHAVLHAGWLHLAFNLYFLWVFGDNVEDAVGRLRFALLAVGFAVVAALGHVLVSPGSELAAVGSSGVVAGLMGMYLVWFPYRRLHAVLFVQALELPAWLYLAFWAVLQVMAFAFALAPNVAFAAHLAGFAAGVLAGVALRRRRRGSSGA